MTFKPEHLTAEHELDEHVFTDADWPSPTPSRGFARLVASALVILARRIDNATPEAQVRAGVREELAALGGHLLTTYGAGALDPDASIATLGGYLLAKYGDDAP